MKTFALLAAAAAALTMTGSALAADNNKAGDNKAAAKHDCFFTRDWDGWSTANDGDVIYLKVKARDVFRLDLLPGSHIRKDPDNFLISKQRGSDWVCSPLDLDLTVSDHSGFKEPVFIKSIRKLTPEEVAALPPKDRP